MSQIPKPYKGEDKYVFISYAHRDNEAVWEIVDEMQKAGYRVWFDEGIDPGTEWDENIATHVDGCFYFIAFISGAYIASQNCRDELNFARDLDKNRLLVYLEDVELPLGMKMRLGRLQAIFYHKYKQDLKTFYERLFGAPDMDACKFIEAERKVEMVSEKNETISADEVLKRTYSEQQKAAFERLKIYQDKLNTVNEAKLKSPYDMNRRGDQYYYGKDGMQQNYAKAIEWYEKSAKTGNIYAMSFLGYIYYNGKGVAKNVQKAKEYFETCAIEKNGYALYWLGYIAAHEKPSNPGLAISYYKLAAQNGYDKANLDLGEMYYWGTGIEADYVEAKKWYEAAAASKEAGTFKYTAQKQLGCIYYYGKGFDVDFETALKWFLDAAKGGNVYAANMAAFCYYYGRGTEVDYKEAVTWYQLAADQNYPEAQRNFGLMYENGKGVEKDSKMAFSWYQKAADAGNTNAKYDLGRCYYYGKGVDVDYKKSRAWFISAAAQGHKKAQESLETLGML